MAEIGNSPIIISYVPLAKEVIVDFLKGESFPLSDAIVNGLLGIVNQVQTGGEKGNYIKKMKDGDGYTKYYTFVI